jgi:hypothetical protein
MSRSRLCATIPSQNGVFDFAFDFAFGRQGDLILNFLSMMNKTDFWNIHNISMSQILDMGNRRECTSRRAEATMSAIGATKWYEKELREKELRENEPCENELRENEPSHPIITGGTAKYPMEYLKEVRILIGSAMFFGSMPSREFKESFIGLKRKPRVIGSLMPVGEHVIVREGMLKVMEEHPSLKT